MVLAMLLHVSTFMIGRIIFALDLGSNMQMQNVGTDRNLLNIYEVSLKSIERKQKSSTNRWIK